LTKRFGKLGQQAKVGVGTQLFDVASASDLSRALPAEIERSLLGSLIDSYDFKRGGLIKKTNRVTLGSRILRLISYYMAADDNFEARIVLNSRGAHSP